MHMISFINNEELIDLELKQNLQRKTLVRT